MFPDAIICRHFTLGDGGDPLGVEFPGRTVIQSPWSRDMAQIRQIATRRGFPFRGSALSQTNMHRGPPDQEQR